LKFFASFRLYFTKVNLGTPPREFYVQIDTGSDVLWVSCASCNGCPQTSGLQVKTLLPYLLIQCYNNEINILFGFPSFVHYCWFFYRFSSITSTLRVHRHLHSSLVLTKGARTEYSHQIAVVPVGTTNARTYSSMEMVAEHQAIMCQTWCILLVLLRDLCCQIPRRL
jgi:hypothetical protein